MYSCSSDTGTQKFVAGSLPVLQQQPPEVFLQLVQSSASSVNVTQLSGLDVVAKSFMISTVARTIYFTSA